MFCNLNYCINTLQNVPNISVIYQRFKKHLKTALALLDICNISPLHCIITDHFDKSVVLTNKPKEKILYILRQMHIPLPCCLITSRARAASAYSKNVSATIKSAPPFTAHSTCSCQQAIKTR